MKKITHYYNSGFEEDMYIYIYIYIYIHTHTHGRETSVCMCYTITVKQKTQCLTNFCILVDVVFLENLTSGPFQKFRMWHLKDRKLIFNVKGKDELMKVEVMKERDKGFICLIQVMICGK